MHFKNSSVGRCEQRCQPDRQILWHHPYMGACRFFLSVKFSTFLHTSRAGGWRMQLWNCVTFRLAFTGLMSTQITLSCHNNFEFFDPILVVIGEAHFNVTQKGFKMGTPALPPTSLTYAGSRFTYIKTRQSLFSISIYPLKNSVYI